MVIRELVNEWLETWCQGLAYNTTQSYINYSTKLVQMFEFLGYSELNVSDIKPFHCQNVLNNLDKLYSPSSLVKYKAILHNIMKCAVRWDLVDHNVIDCCILPRHNQRKEMLKHWNADQAATFSHWLTHCYCGNHQEILFIFLALSTGARRGELVALTHEDIGYGYININKSTYRSSCGQLTKEPKSKHGCRIVTVSPKITDKIDDMLLRRCRVDNIITPYVFTQSDNVHQMALDTPSHFFNKIVKQAPVPFITLHGLRHTHASILITEGVDVATVSKRLGHSKTSVTLDIYTHSSPTEDNNASATISRILGI